MLAIIIELNAEVREVAVSSRPVLLMAHSISLRSVVAALQGRVSRPVGDEVVILDSEKEQYFGLNSVGARIWTLLEEPTEVSEIRKVILEEFEVDSATCERDLLALLDELLSRNMIEIRPPTPLPRSCPPPISERR